ncbi:MAG: DUF1465 family protein [Pseudomonadota bacterium]
MERTNLQPSPNDEAPVPVLVTTDFVDRLLAEAAGLAEMTRDLVVQPAELPARGLDRLHDQVEIGRLTTCLAHCVAWLLEQKAVAAGEIERATRPPLARIIDEPQPDPLAVSPYVVDVGHRVRAFARRIDRLANG